MRLPDLTWAEEQQLAALTDVEQIALVRAMREGLSFADALARVKPARESSITRAFGY